MREKVGKSRNTVFFQCSGAPEGRKVGSLKRQVRSQLARGEMKNCMPLWREAHFQVKVLKTLGVRTTFGTWESENAQNTPFSDHFFKLRCRKSARRYGAKHISKSKCTKHTMCGPFLEVEMSKKCTPLWHEAHFEVKMYKAHHVRTIFWGSDVVSRGRCKGLWTLSKMSKTWGFCNIFNYNHHYTTPHDTPIHYATLQLQLHLHYILLHYTPLHYTALNYTQLHYTTLHYTPLHTLHYITLHYITLHYATLHYTTLPSTTLRYTTLHYLLLHYTTLHYTTLHYIALHYIHSTALQLHYTTFHYTPLHYTQLHYTTLHSTTFHNTTQHYTTLHYTTFHTFGYLPLHSTPLHSTTLHYTTLHWMTLHHR